MKTNTIFKYVKIIFPFALFFIIFFEGKKELQNIDVRNILLNIHLLSFSQIVCMVLFGLIGMSTMMLYDFVLIKQLHLQIPSIKVMKYSWISNSFNNVLGFGGLAGASLRSLLFKRFTPNLALLISSILWMTPLMLAGLSLLAWIPIFHFVNVTPIIETHHWILYAIWGIALYLPASLVVWTIMKKRNHLGTFSPPLISVISIILVSLVEWIFALFTLSGITHVLGTTISFQHLTAIFIAAAVAGSISMVPGGAGSFDLIFLIGIQLYHVQADDILIVLLFYRLTYYIVPLLIGLMLASTEVISQTKDLLNQPKWKKLDMAWKRYSIIPEYLITNISHWALSALIFISGILLLLSAATPGILERITFTEKILSEPIMQLSHQLSVITGILLLLMSRGIQLKVKRSYTLSYIFLLTGALFTFSKGFDYEEAIFLVGIAVLLRFSKKQFYRENYPLSWINIFSLGVLTIGSLIFYVSIGYLNQPYLDIHMPLHIKDLVIKQPDELILSGIIGLSLSICLLNALHLFRHQEKVKTDRNINQEIEQFLDNNQGNVLTHLIYLQDKNLFWTSDKKVLFMYAKISDNLVVLGDPIGKRENLAKGIEEFQNFADVYGLKTVFYQVEKELLPLYHENGYQFFKLGEEAYVDLMNFTLTGKKKASLRAVKNKFERENFHFEIVQPPFSIGFLNDLKEVSDQWLGNRKEKGFSLGFFDEYYLQRAPVAILRDSDGEIMAFATLMPVYDETETLSVDLMRFTKDSPNGTMDMLFISIMEYAKEKGYKWFNLGMAPLANVGQTKYAFLSERLASKLYMHGHFFYNFSGLRRYKEKFAVRWEPKYLAFKNRPSLPHTMLQLSILIGKKRNKK